jgi:ADP-ribose pyrophosphatase YjhB (NUDIX family)
MDNQLPQTREIGRLSHQYAVRGDDPLAGDPPVFLDDEEYGRARMAGVWGCVDLVVVSVSGDVLLGLRSAPPVRDWCIQGGRMKRGETFEATARRIAREEFEGLKFDEERLLPAGFSNYIFGEGGRQDLTVHLVYLVTDEEATAIRLNPKHFEGQLWVPLLEVAKGEHYDLIVRRIAENALIALGTL